MLKQKFSELITGATSLSGRASERFGFFSGAAKGHELPTNSALKPLVFLPPPVGLHRQISARYIGPDGNMTNDDPTKFSDLATRIRYENCLLRDLPWSGYARGILESRAEEAAALSRAPALHR